jgi:outer membrane protein
MRLIRIFSFVALLPAGSFLLAQEQTYSLTLNEAREYALQHNKILLNARDNVTSSREMVKETISQGLPQVNSGMDFMTYFNYELNFNFGGTGGGPDIDYSVLDEGDLEVLNALDQMFGPSEPIIMNNQLSGKVQVNQLLFSGQYWAGIQTARIAVDLADRSLVKSELDIKENITNSYYLILTLERSLQIIIENLNNLKMIRQHTDNLYKMGIAEATDVDQLSITVSQLVNSQKSVERNIQLNYNMMKFQLGVPPDAKITLADNLDKVMGNIRIQETLTNQFDIEQNINYQLVESQVMLNKKQLEMENWAYGPTFSGFYSYTEKILTTSFDLTPKHLAGFNMSLPIFSSGMRRSRVAQAKINLDIALRNQELTKETLAIQNNQLLFNYQNALENFNTQKESVDIANRVLTSIQNKFREGLVSSLDLTQANSNYLDAERNYLSSILELLQAQIALDKLYNKL